MKTSILCPNDVWRTVYRKRHPGIGRKQGAAITDAWSNSRDAGELLGITARLHPQLRGCIEALDIPRAPRTFEEAWLEHQTRRRTFPDGHVIRHSASDAEPLWGRLMRSQRLRVRLAVIAWCRGVDLDTVREIPTSEWERYIGVEQARERAVRNGTARDIKEKLNRELVRLQQEAVSAPPPHPDPRTGLPGHQAHEWSSLAEKYGIDPETRSGDGLERTSVPDALLLQGWHLVAPELTLGWMVAQSVLGSTKGRARALGTAHLGLREGFRAADRARYFLGLSRSERDLATITLQRTVLWALADLGVIPTAVTDAGTPIQTLMVGREGERDCCVLLCGDRARVWHRDGSKWRSEPTLLARIEESFSMRLRGGDVVTIEGLTVAGRSVRRFQVTDLQLHTFPSRPDLFPAKAWSRRTGLDSRVIAPTFTSAP